MKFNEFIASKSDDDLQAYAQRCGTTVFYLKNQLKNAYKTPRNRLLNALWQESNGELSRDEVMQHFFPPPSEQLAAG